MWGRYEKLLPSVVSEWPPQPRFFFWPKRGGVEGAIKVERTIVLFVMCVALRLL